MQTTNITIDAICLPEQQKKKDKCDDACAYYLCDELDCGFSYHYKLKHGPSRNRPLLTPQVLVVALNKKVSLRLIGWGQIGFARMIDHGHEGYIFPVNLHDRPFRIDPKLVGEEDEKWQRLIASFKGVTYVSSRKNYVLVNKNGEIVRRKLCNEIEFAETLKFSANWQARHPNEESYCWKLEENVS